MSGKNEPAWIWHTSNEDPLLGPLFERQARSDEDLATLRYEFARSPSPRSWPMSDGAGEDTMSPVSRRGFMVGGLGLVGLAAVDTEELSSIFSGRTRLDDAALDGLEAITRAYQQQYDIAPPKVLLPAVRFHLLQMRNWERSGMPFPRRLAAIAAETAILAGRLSQRVQNRSDADEFFLMGSSLGTEAADPRVEAMALAARSSLYSNFDGGRPLGRPLVALTMLDQAVQLIGNGDRSGLAAWILTHRSEEHAAAGDANAAEHDLDDAEAALANRSSSEAGPFSTWEPDRLLGYRGCCAVLLGSKDSVSILEKAAAHTNSALASQRSATLIDLGTAYARQAEIDEACGLLSEVLTVAQTFHLPEIARRVENIRLQELPRGATPALSRLDDQLLSGPMV